MVFHKKLMKRIENDENYVFWFWPLEPLGAWAPKFLELIFPFVDAAIAADLSFRPPRSLGPKALGQ